ncbi:nuclear transport factor 2 family protein [Staphylococcus epidermidis]|uniref:nuclear transport factor 2 family protein n=1 Tax=Staphylococcus epidermidis TaxID=1282 RepID=UPI000F7EB177|nr:hypothetical protein [Staphylococcus epidermidis]MCG1272699.1 hypothetical protein [Staphylococcus epidermidis]RTE16733.1 hypothetical protein BKL64_01135 [Staphylococcus epidermidis]RTE17045.1 hypothetical protein BKL63_03615 [Staphylococcus epidermidis]RTE17326.1 hypothetical protein BKL62_02430 [Staphylococcus epidermidis]RTE19974.1 hypothetical protein BKL71_08450 [Staphylococcus epidermidis]
MGLEKNKEIAMNFYKTAFLGNPSLAIEKYVGDVYYQHNLVVEDVKCGFIKYFEETYKYCPEKTIDFIRVIAEEDLVSLHNHQVWGFPDNKEYVTMDFFRFLDGKIIEHWDSIQEVVLIKSGRKMY